MRGLRLERNEIVDGRAKGTGEYTELECQLVFRSIGYSGVPLAGIPFDERRGLIRNEGGRVVDQNGDVCPGEYATGWIKRGPSGVIGTNKKDSLDTVSKLIEDAKAGRLLEPASDDIDALIAQTPHAVDWQGWEAIDRLEREAGEPQGRPRVKLVEWDELRRAAHRGAMTAD